MPDIDDEELDEENYIFPKEITSIEDPLERAENVVFYLTVKQHNFAFAKMLEAAPKLFTTQDLEQIQQANPELITYITKDKFSSNKHKLQNLTQQILPNITEQKNGEIERGTSPTSVADKKVLEKKENPIITKLKKGGAVKLPSAAKTAVIMATENINESELIEPNLLENAPAEQTIMPQSTLLVTDIALSDYQKFTAEDIVKDNLIAVAAYQKNLEAVKFMSNELQKSSGLDGAGNALEAGLEELIRVIPSICEQAAIPRDNALKTFNDVKKQNSFNYSLISLQDSAIQNIITQHNLSSFKLAKDRLTRAKDLLKQVSDQKTNEAQEAYDIEKEKARAVSDNCLVTAQSIITNSALDLSDFNIQRLSPLPLKIQENIRDTIFKIREGAGEISKPISNKSLGKVKSANVEKFLGAQASLGIEQKVDNYKQALADFEKNTKAYTEKQIAAHILDPDNIRENSLQEIPATIDEKKAKMTKLLLELGIKEEVLTELTVTKTAEKAALDMAKKLLPTPPREQTIFQLPKPTNRVSQI